MNVEPEDLYDSVLAAGRGSASSVEGQSMTDHDPLCVPARRYNVNGAPRCDCALIRQAEQRGIEEAIRKYGVLGTDDRAYDQGLQDALAAAEPLVCTCYVTPHSVKCLYSAVAAAIRGGSDE